ncbi:MAG TPA: hypothetical protein VFY71_08565 [Planctomycetota bacterium]|nr:hypothetical protein [Planctomycetota bacterium]
MALLAHDLKNDLHAAVLAAAVLDFPDLPESKRRAQLAIIQACLLRMKERLADASADAQASAPGPE